MTLEDLIIPAAAIAGGLAVIAWVIYSRFYVVVPPDRALVLFGAKRNATPRLASPRAATLSGEPRVVVGRGAFIAPWQKGMAYLPLGILDVDVMTHAASSADAGGKTGWDVRIGVQVQISGDSEALRSATENLLGKPEEELRTLVRHTVEGCVPGAIARLGREQVENDWDRLASEVQAAAATELVSYGLVVRSLTVRELNPISYPLASGPISPDLVTPVVGLSPAQVDMLDRLHRLEVRFDQVERGLGAVGAEVVRRLREPTATSEDLPPEETFEGPVDRRSVPAANAAVLPDDSAGGDRPPDHPRARGTSRRSREPSGDRTPLNAER